MCTEQGPGHALMSWWPTVSVWNNFAQHSRWTEKVEGWYNDRLASIRAGTAKPLNAEKWRERLRGSSSSRHINRFVNAACDRFVDGHVTA